MFAVVGTIPIEEFALVAGEVLLEADTIRVNERKVPVSRGTPALLAGAAKACQVLDLPMPFAYLVGDTGLGRGSRSLYEYLVKDLPSRDFSVITFHYLQPDVDWHNKVLFAVDEMNARPILIADAGFMYVAKMSGQSEAYELFTPDAGELSFLADEEAPHPFYTRGFILHDQSSIPDLISRAYKYDNAARHLLVKGSQDYVASRTGIHHVIDSPVDEALEAIGGTGDTLTGIVTTLIASGIATLKASGLAARINRLAGHFARPTPASQVMDMIEHIPTAMSEIMNLTERPHGCKQSR